MERIVVVGNGMVSYKFCEKIRNADPEKKFEITVIGEEPRPAYDRVHLSEFFSNKTAEDLLMASADWYNEQQIKLLTGELVTEIDRASQTITTHKGNSFEYDKLILATGSSCFIPPLNGVDKKGVFAYRTIEDLVNIKSFGKKIKTAAVLGGGLLGLEAAKALLDMGLEAHVIEFASRLMPRQLDDAGAEMLKRTIESLGVKVHLNKATSAIEGNGKLDGLSFADGSMLEVDMLVISAGIRPRDELAKVCGLDMGARGGVVVNDHLQTSDPSIYAIGEVALHKDMIYGLVAPGYQMANVVAEHITGKGTSQFTGFDMSTKLKLIGTEVASFGDALGVEDHVPVIYQNMVNGVYKRINISKDGTKLLGGVLVGDSSDYNKLQQITLGMMPMPSQPEALIFPAVSGGDEGMGIESLPDEALICSCEGITKKQIVDAVEKDGITDVSGMKKATKACTGCGGCTPLVGDLISLTLKSQGLEIKKTLCEHFDYTRQEMYEIIKVTGIRSYNELLEKHGKGHGCETCKPAVASLFASIWNDHITVQDTIQDTNDRFLANIQKGGSYSVVPRVPGGEITPEQLIAIGQIAKKYDLYTKITGGQRIDLFGARIDQLPHIWEELINVGMESGHAYGKALRTVKSCVGSTWCRFGVQDSVGFAIEVENRYKGIRAPHKIKSAVSGCIRECAEAQSKDFGIIATEKGWNLYVGGNGGARPQHALLLASDIDKETCIKYIDRYLMYYIRTAEPLMRTATWLNKLEGGLNHLKDVIINDTLGIASQLEEEMQKLVDTFHCEWKKVVEDPEMRKKFSHFINTDEQDDALVFVDARGQKKPLGWNVD